MKAWIAGIAGVIIGACLIVIGIWWTMPGATQQPTPDEAVKQWREAQAAKRARLITEDMGLDMSLELATPAQAADILARKSLGPALTSQRGVIGALLIVEALRVWQPGARFDADEVARMVKPHAKVLKRARESLRDTLKSAGMSKACGVRACSVVTPARLTRAYRTNAVRASDRYGDGVIVGVVVERVATRGGVVRLATRSGLTVELERGDEHQREAAARMRRRDQPVLYCPRVSSDGAVIGRACRVITDEMTRKAARGLLADGYRRVMLGAGVRLSPAQMDTLTARVYARMIKGSSDE